MACLPLQGAGRQPHSSFLALNSRNGRVRVTLTPFWYALMSCHCSSALEQYTRNPQSSGGAGRIEEQTPAASGDSQQAQPRAMQQSLTGAEVQPNELPAPPPFPPHVRGTYRQTQGLKQYAARSGVFGCTRQRVLRRRSGRREPPTLSPKTITARPKV